MFFDKVKDKHINKDLTVSKFNLMFKRKIYT